MFSAQSAALKALAIVPCYNEEGSVAAVVGELNGYRAKLPCSLTVLVVDDGSMDRTSEIAAQLDCILLRLPINLGIGGAMQSGFRYAFRNGYDLALQVDGDGQHPASEIPTLLAPLLANEADAVIGSRFLSIESFRTTYWRRVGISYFRRLNYWLTGVSVSDSTSGFRAYNRNAFQLFAKEYPDDYPEPSSIVQLHYMGMRIREVAVEMRSRDTGESSITAIKSVYYMMKVSLACYFNYLKYKRKLKK